MADSFILQSYLEDISICDELMRHHDNNPDKKPGVIAKVNGNEVDKNLKDSEDSTLLGELANRYLTQLQVVIDQYIAKYPQCNMYSAFTMIKPAQLQRYRPGTGFFAWHTERTSANTHDLASRHLVFMTYLNDVTDGGETEFALQNLKVQPRKGLTLIWPADWTHTHRGITSPTQDKYIATGWLNYV